MKGALKFISEDLQMQMLIFKSKELEIINSCFFKKKDIHIDDQLPDDLIEVLEKFKGIRHLVNSVYNKLIASIKKNGKHDKSAVKK